jgi:DNA helicase HerA-like ATPase
MTNLMCRGRKRGLAGIIATQRLAKLAKNVAAEASNFLMGRTFLDIDMARAADLLGMDRRQAEMFRDLARGHFVALGPALSRRPLPVVIGAVETQAQSANPKLKPLPETPVDVAALIFTAASEEAARPVRRPAAPMVTPTAEILAQLSRPRPVTVEEPALPEIDPAERDGLIDSVMREVLEDPESGFRSVAVLYQDFLVRCRIHRVPGEPLALPAFRRRLAVGRANVAAEIAAGDEWRRVLELAERLPDDVHSVFLTLAQAAVTAAPCPPDATLARLYGTHSVSRARRLLSYFEERDLVVLRTDFHGRRIVAFPDLGLETAPGDPAAPDMAIVAAS